MTPFQFFMILKTNKQDATKSYSEVCWAGSALSLWGPGSPFCKPPVFKPTELRRRLAPSPLRVGAEPSRGRTRRIFTAATAARAPQHHVPFPAAVPGPGPGRCRRCRCLPPRSRRGCRRRCHVRGVSRGEAGWAGPGLPPPPPAPAAGAAAEGASGARCHGGPVQPQEPG